MKSCFVLLLRNNLKSNLVNRCLNSLYNFYLKRYPTDIVVFHEKNFSEYNKNFFKIRLPNTKVIFKEIQFSVPDSIKKDFNFKPKWIEGYWDSNKCISYGGMCTFFARDIFNYLNEMEYEYYARLDDDSSILNPINYNIFEYMKTNDLIYGYLIKMLEAPHVVNGLFDFIVNNLDEEEIINKEYSFIDSNNLIYYYNNFEIIDIKKYLNKTKNIIEKIHESGNIYYWRWGDAPIRTILISMMFDQSKIKKMTDIDYHHEPAKIINNVVNCNCKLPSQ
jgi:hypothetical protein